MKIPPHRPSGPSFGPLAGMVLTAVGLSGVAEVSAAAGPSLPPAPPNVLYITVDDLNQQVAAFGSAIALTPRMDELAARGVRFTRAYAQYPVCGPSRVSFLSGWYAQKTGYYATGDSQPPRQGPLATVRYLPQAFREAGYTAARLDKVFHIGSDDPSSWDITEEPFKNPNGSNKIVWQGNEPNELGLGPSIRRQGSFSSFNGENGQFYELDNSIDPNGLVDGLTTTRAIQLVEQFARQGDRFFLAVGYRRPHLPTIAPQRFFDLYPRDQLPPQPDQPGREKLPDADYRQALQAYLACVTMVDEQIGRLLDAVEEAGLLDNTIVVLHGDHGYNHGERENRWGKGNLFERSLWTPLIVAEPASPRAGERCDRVVGLIDLYPTLLDLCGLGPGPGHLDGRSLRPLLRDQAADWEDYAASYINSNQYRTLRDARYRLVTTPQGQPVELYDLPADPLEWNNLINSPDHAGIIARMNRRLDEILRDAELHSVLTITRQPESVSAPEGDPVVLSVEVQGPGPRRFQWTRAGVAVPGADQAALVLTSLDSAATGVYECLVTNPAGSLRSAAATVTLGDPAGVGELILDNTDPRVRFTGSHWTVTQAGAGQHGSNWETTGTNSGATALYEPALPLGSYRIYTWHPVAWSWLASEVPCTVEHRQGGTALNVNQQSTGGEWVPLAAQTFDLDSTSRVVLGSPAHAGRPAWDAVRFVGSGITPGPSPVAEPDPPALCLDAGPVFLAPLANDHDPDGAVLALGTVTAPGNGVLTREGNGLWYRPVDGFSDGDDSFTYRAFNGTRESPPVTITVRVRSTTYARWAAQRAWRGAAGSAPEQDGLGIGLPNFAVYALGLDLLPGSALSISFQDGGWTLNLPRREAAVDIGRRWDQSSDLVFWQSWSPPPASTRPALQPGLVWDQIPCPAPAQGAVYYRIHLSPEEP